MEGALAGVPSIAVGHDFNVQLTRQMEFSPSEEDEARFGFAARFTEKVVRFLSEYEIPETIKVVNLNFHKHADTSSPVEITFPARYNYGNFLQEEEGGFYHGGSPKDLSRAPAGSDMAALREGKISVTFLGLLSHVVPEEDFSTSFLKFFNRIG